ncbi:MAG: hypothetical protein ABSA30_07500, partial [Candidatus Aminicenantales bacterium]
MKRFPARTAVFAILLVLSAGLSPIFGRTAQAPEAQASQAAMAKFGDYKAIAQEPYDTWVRSSLYLKMRDGIRLAVDILRP